MIFCITNITSFNMLLVNCTNYNDDIGYTPQIKQQKSLCLQHMLIMSKCLP